MKFTKRLLVIISVLLIASCSTSKENKYTITGRVPSQVQAEWIYLYNLNGQEPVVVDSAAIKNGSFTFNGIVPDSIVIAVVHPGGLYEYPAVAWSVILEPGDIVVDTINQFAAGTPINDGLASWMTQLDSIMTVNPDPASVKNFLREHWSEHSSDFVGSLVLSQFSPYLEFPFVDSLATQIPDDIRNITLLKPFFDQIESVRKSQPGKPYIDETLATIDGKEISLSDYIGKGQYVLVDFWASWCGPCRQAMPELKSVVSKYKNLKVVGIAVSDELEKTKKAISDLGISWTVLCDPEGKSAQAYGINAIPAMILFAPDGTIESRDFMVSGLDDILSGKL